MITGKTYFLFCLLFFVLFCVIVDTVVKQVEWRLKRKFDKLVTPCMIERECNSGNIETLISFTNELDERLKKLEEWQYEVDEHLLKLTDGYYGKLSFKEMLGDFEEK